MPSVLSQNLLETADYLLFANDNEPKQAHLCRAVSSVYYAMFHILAQQCADAFIGANEEPESTREAWRQVYRALEHTQAKQACKDCQKQGSKFPEKVQEFAKFFIQYQAKRHYADYDPYTSFAKDEIADMIRDARQIIADFETVEFKHRRAFAAFTLFKKR